MSSSLPASKEVKVRNVVIQHENVGRKFVIEEKPIPHVGKHDVLILIAATSVSGFDLFRRWYTTSIRDLNQLLGMECSGTIDRVGKEVTRFRVGDQVCALLAGGGYAQYVAVDSRLVLPIPRGIRLVDAASLPHESCFVWYSLVMKGELRQACTILILRGCDEYGPLAIAVAKFLDCIVLTTTRTKEETKYCEAIGADYCLEYFSSYETLANFVFESTRGKGVDFVFDLSGLGVSPNIKVLAKQGTLVYSGGHQWSTDDWDFESIRFKQLKVIGVNCVALSPASKYKIVEEVTEKFWPSLSKLSKFDVHDHIYRVYSFSDVSRAHHAMAHHTNEGKKILLTPSSEFASPGPIDPPPPIYILWWTIVGFILITLYFMIYG